GRRSARGRAAARSAPAAASRVSAGGGATHRAAAVRSSLPLAGEVAPENHRSGGAVDVSALHAPPALAARASRRELRARLEGGEALIDQVDRQCEAAFELGGKAAHAFTERPLTAVGIIRGADHELRGCERAYLTPDRLPVRPRRASAHTRPRPAPASPDRTAGRGALLPVSVSPEAIPMRLSPKSKARTVLTALGMT